VSLWCPSATPTHSRTAVDGRIGSVIERIAHFIQDPGAGSFEELALAVFAYQYEHIEPYRTLCDGRGATPGSVADWRQVPPVPAAAFRRLRLAAAPEQEVFRSSGTSGGEEARSVHYHPFPDLYRQTIDAAFPRHCLPGGGAAPVPMLSLVPSREQLPDSSLAFMIDHVLSRFGAPAPESAVAIGRRGVEMVPARSWAGARQRSGRPALILATSLALAQWLDALERQDLRFRLPAGSAVFETGGYKGRTEEVSPARERRRLEERLGVPANAVVREYGMTELTSQCYTRALAGGDPDLFFVPHWVRLRVLDPATLEEAPPGTPGLIAIFDLANLGSAAHLLTEDLGVAEGWGGGGGPSGEGGGGQEGHAVTGKDGTGGFRLLGRAASAELRGCSLVAEELQKAGRW
jgi:Acyl-protein synthetase, LuxE